MWRFLKLVISGDVYLDFTLSITGDASIPEGQSALRLEPYQTAWLAN
jgi:hypothetical protein